MQLQVTPSGSIVAEKQKMHGQWGGDSGLRWFFETFFALPGAKRVFFNTFTLSLQILVVYMILLHTVIAECYSFLGRCEISWSQGFSDFYPEELPRRGLQTDLAMSFGCRKGRFGWCNTAEQNMNPQIDKTNPRPLDSLGSSAKVGARALQICW